MNAGELDQRIKAAQSAMVAMLELAVQMAHEVDAFFARHPQIVRTEGAATIATVIAFEGLSPAIKTNQQKTV
jgi:hypothetical protein